MTPVKETIHSISLNEQQTVSPSSVETVNGQTLSQLSSENKPYSLTTKLVGCAIALTACAGVAFLAYNAWQHGIENHDIQNEGFDSEVPQNIPSVVNQNICRLWDQFLTTLPSPTCTLWENQICPSNATISDFIPSTGFTPNPYMLIDQTEEIIPRIPSVNLLEEYSMANTCTQSFTDFIANLRSDTCMDPKEVFKFQENSLNYETLTEKHMQQLFGQDRILSDGEARGLYNRIAEGIKEFGVKAFDHLNHIPDHEVAEAACQTRHAARVYVRTRGSIQSQEDAEYMD